MAEPENHLPLGGRRVLFAEDEYLIAADGQQMLEKLGAEETVLVGNFNEAEKAAADGAYDLALLDLNLNGRMSTEFVHLLDGVPLIFASGYRLSRDLLEEHAAVHLAKPYNLADLSTAVTQALGRK